MSTAGKEIRNTADRSLIHYATLVHENQMVKRLKNLTGRLVDCEKYTGSSVGDFLQNLA